MNPSILVAIMASLALCAVDAACAAAVQIPPVYDQQEGYVDNGGVYIYYKSIGRGQPLMILHGGPGGSHDSFLPYLLPLSASRRLLFIDERGSGRSSRPEKDDSYTLTAMTSDVEAVRRSLHLGRIDLLGHSFGGILAQAYVVEHANRVRRLVLASTWSSAARINVDFEKIKRDADLQTVQAIDALEARSIFDASGAQLPEYRKLADTVEAPYLYFVHRPAWDEPATATGWRVLRRLWCGRSDFHVDGHLTGFDYSSAFAGFDVQTLIILGDHDLVQSESAELTHASMPHSILVKLVDSGHMSFVDQPDRFSKAVANFLR